jgi:hypothetical protein
MSARDGRRKRGKFVVRRVKAFPVEKGGMEVEKIKRAPRLCEKQNW